MLCNSGYLLINARRWLQTSIFAVIISRDQSQSLFVNLVVVSVISFHSRGDRERAQVGTLFGRALPLTEHETKGHLCIPHSSNQGMSHVVQAGTRDRHRSRRRLPTRGNGQRKLLMVVKQLTITCDTKGRVDAF